MSEVKSPSRVWRKCCHGEARSQPGKHMHSVVRNPISPQLRVYFELRSSKSPCDRTDSCASLAQLGDVHGEQLPSCWRKTTEGQKKLSEEEGAGNLAIMGLMWWKKAQKSEVPHEDKHPPEKCFSRISNTKILRFTETEPKETSWESALCASLCNPFHKFP